MGMSFCSLHIKGSDLKDISEIITEEYIGCNISTNWISVYEREACCDWFEILALGRAVSKKLNLAIIAVNYMDDDVFQLVFIARGAQIATYRNCMDGRIYKDINKVVNSFELDKDEADIIKYLVKMSLPIEKSVDMFSMLFGINFYSDFEMVSCGLKPIEKNIPFLLDEIKKHKKNSKIKNITKLTMQQELPGIRMYYFAEDDYNNIIRLAKPNQDGGFQFDNINCIQITSEGLKEVYRTVYPVDTFSDKYNGITIDYGFKEIELLCKEDYYNIKKLDWDEYEPLVSKLYRIPESYIVKEEGFTVNSFSTYDENRYLYKCDEANLLHKYDGRISGETPRENVSVAQFDFEEIFSENDRWRCSFNEARVLEDKLILITERRVDERGFYNVVCFFDKELNLLRSEEFPNWRYDVTTDRFAYDEEEDLIYMTGRVIDLKQHEIKRYSGDFDSADFTIIHRDNSGKKYIINVAGSKVFVQDTNLNILSSHKVKGYILYWYVGNNGNLNFVSEGSNFHDYTKKKDSALRRYELEFI